MILWSSIVFGEISVHHLQMIFARGMFRSKSNIEGESMQSLKDNRSFRSLCQGQNVCPPSNNTTGAPSR